MLHGVQVALVPLELLLGALVVVVVVVAAAAPLFHQLSADLVSSNQLDIYRGKTREHYIEREQSKDIHKV